MTDHEARIAKLEAAYLVLDRIEDKVDEISKLIAQVATIREKQDNQSGSLSRAFTEISEVREELEEYKDKSYNVHKETNAAIRDERELREKNEKTVSEFINKMKGAWMVFTVIIVLVQGVMSTALISGLKKFVEYDNRISIIEYKEGLYKREQNKSSSLNTPTVPKIKRNS